MYNKIGGAYFESIRDGGGGGEGREKNDALFNRRLFSKAIYGERSKLPPRPLLFETPLVGYMIALIGISALSPRFFTTLFRSKHLQMPHQQSNVPPL